MNSEFGNEKPAPGSPEMSKVPSKVIQFEAKKHIDLNSSKVERKKSMKRQSTIEQKTNTINMLMESSQGRLKESAKKQSDSQGLEDVISLDSEARRKLTLVIGAFADTGAAKGK